MNNKLERKYGLFTAICMVVGIVIGSGVFFKAQTILQITNGDMPLGVIAWLIGGAIMLACILTFAGMSQKYEKVNGIVDYANAPVVGLLVGVTALVPIFGAWIGGGLSAFLILLVDPGKVILFVVFLLILQQVEGNLIYPRVVGSALGLPGLLVLCAVLVGGNIGGVVGMLMGVPVVAVVYELLRRGVAHRIGKENT